MDLSIPGGHFPGVELRPDSIGDSHLAWGCYIWKVFRWDVQKSILRDKYLKKNKFSEHGLPTTKITNEACRSIFHLSRASHLPYSEKHFFVWLLYIIIYRNSRSTAPADVMFWGSLLTHIILTPGACGREVPSRSWWHLTDSMIRWVDRIFYQFSNSPNHDKLTVIWEIWGLW